MKQHVPHFARKRGGDDSVVLAVFENDTMAVSEEIRWGWTVAANGTVVAENNNLSLQKVLGLEETQPVVGRFGNLSQ